MQDGNTADSQQVSFTILNPAYSLSPVLQAATPVTGVNDSDTHWFLSDGKQKKIPVRILQKDSTWHKLDRGDVYFMKLSPDNFMPHAANVTNTSAKGVDSIEMEIIPPFYQTAWFIIISILTGLIILFTIFYIRLLVIKKRTDLEKEILAKDAITSAFKQKLADTELSAIRSQMNPHFIFNCLNSIKLYTEQNNSKAASEYVTKFSMLIRLVLENSRSERISLANELQALELYIQMESMRFKNKLRYEIAVDKSIDTDYIEIPPLLLQPYLENAIWHGLMHKEDGGCIKLAITKHPQDDVLVVTISDNGVGRAKAMELKSKSATRHKSFGMKLTQDRISLINQLYKTTTAVEITDLFGSNAEPSGTMVVIQIPIS